MKISGNKTPKTKLILVVLLASNPNKLKLKTTEKKARITQSPNETTKHKVTFNGNRTPKAKNTKQLKELRITGPIGFLPSSVNPNFDKL